MKYVAGLSSLLIPFCVILVLSLIRRSADKSSNKMSDNDFCVQIPKGVFVLGLIGTLLFVVFGCISIFDADEDFSSVLTAGVVCGVLSSLGVYLMVYTLSHKVIVKNNDITVFSAFNKPYSFTFDDIISAKRKVLGQNEKIVVKTSRGKKFAVEMGESAYEKFVAAIKIKAKAEYLHGF